MLDALYGESGRKGPGAYALGAHYYRFLDSQGKVIEPTDPRDAGIIPPKEEAQLALGKSPEKAETGYLAIDPGRAARRVDEVIAMPIVSTRMAMSSRPSSSGFTRTPRWPGANSGISSGMASRELPHAVHEGPGP